METPRTYFTRRAGQEREIAAHAGSADARKAHLELAFRLVRVATEPALWDWSGNDPAGPGLPQHDRPDGLGKALAKAFPLPASGRFEHLLQALDSEAA